MIIDKRKEERIKEDKKDERKEKSKGAMMAFIEELVLHNFKSFKKADIKFEKGFTCIVGPNGSGKSNVCDALLFALGESSLKRMRASSASQLLNNSVRKTNEGKAYVKTTFRLDDNKTLEVERFIKSDGKVLYKLNGKHTTRQEIIEELRAIKSEITDANTITQGEINNLLNLSGRERRGLIDIAAGIKEFDEKKDAALKDLEKVEQKINEAKIMLNERYGFMEELEKEKKDAEKYLELENIIKRSNYTILKLREKDIEEKYNQALESLKKTTGALNDIISKLDIIERNIKEKSAERDKYSKELSSRNAELGRLNKRIEELNKSIAVSSAQKDANISNSRNIRERIDELKRELKEANEKYAQNKKRIEELVKEIDEKSAYIKKNANKNIADRYAELNELLAKRNEEKSKLNQELAGLEQIIKNEAEAVKELAPIVDELNNELEEQKDKIEDIKNELNEVNENIEKTKAETAKLRKSLEEMDAQKRNMLREELSLREEIARSGGSGRIEELLKANVAHGVYGSALSLCSFDEGYEKAAYAAGGSRLNYIVVENIDVANTCIKILRNNNLRTSFIPINDIKIAPTQRSSGHDYIIDHVKFDKKFSRVFDYIYGDTSIIESILSVKEKRAGRYVTLEGDIVESTGIVTGGSIRISGIGLEAKMKKLVDERSRLEEQYSEFSVMLDSLKEELSGYEKDKLELELKLTTLLNEGSKSKGELESSNAKLNAHKTALENANVEKRRIIEELNKLNNEAEPIVKELDELRSRLENSSEDNAKREEELEKYVERLKIEKATLEKENEMYSKRIHDIDASINRLEAELKNIDASIKELESLMEKANSEKESLQTELEGHDKASSKIYNSIKEVDDIIATLSIEKGRLSSERLNREREKIDLEGRISQNQTRLGDIKAELAGYEEMEMIDKKIDELEKDIALSKSMIEKLGNVNLKAPEMYEEKKKETEEAMNKLKTLQTEKDSVLSMIEQIESKKYNVFMDTFNKVNENFKKLYSYVFDGEAKLVLENPKDLFNTALLIDAKIGKETQNTEQFSGGQKSMLMLILVFSLQMMNPMSLYIFDEIDTALDKENTKKLSKLIKELSKNSQFIVVSHNDALITSADNAIGVIMKDGISSVVGIKISNIMQQAEA